jgi:RNA polymerase sigma-70 factor (ECF subfamily)
VVRQRHPDRLAVGHDRSPLGVHAGIDTTERENGTCHDDPVTSTVLERARAGDGDAFRQLVQPYRRELHLHCYRLLGSLTDAEDVLQDVLLAAWRGLDRFEERASVRTWLYRIATNRCLNARRDAGRRPAEPLPPFDPPEPTHCGEITWLQPLPGV